MRRLRMLLIHTRKAIQFPIMGHDLRQRIYPSARRLRVHPELDEGFSLIELMVVLALSGVLMAAVYSSFTSQQRSWNLQRQVTDMQQSGRTAMEFLAKEIRMAGFGMPQAAVNGFAEAINPANNATNGTDGITIVSAYRQISTTTSDALTDATAITLQDAAHADRFDTGARRYLYLDGISQRDNYEVTGILGSNLTVTPSLQRDYTANSPVFLVKAVTYGIDFTGPAHPCLVRNENTGSADRLIASDIEDMQFAYRDVDGNWHDDPPAVEDVRAIRITVVARTSLQDSEWERAGTGVRPAAEDHGAAGTRDGYRRRIFTTEVDVRNMGLER